MKEKYQIAVIVGSLRRGSYNRMMANALIAIAPESLQMEIVAIGQLALYNQDFEENLPTEYTEFRNRIRTYDGFIFVTPEYNRSVPAVMKNAIDVGSRPPANNAWSGKPGAVISVTRGALGALAANQHLRLSLSAVNIAVMPAPEAYIGSAPTLFNDQGELIVDSTREFLKKFMAAFEVWVRRFAPEG